MHSPQLIILDEPTSNLDDEGKEVVYNLVKEEGRKNVVVIASNEKTDLSLCEQSIFLGDYKNWKSHCEEQSDEAISLHLEIASHDSSRDRNDIKKETMKSFALFKKDINSAVKFAKESPDPLVEDALKFVIN